LKSPSGNAIPANIALRYFFNNQRGVPSEEIAQILKCAVPEAQYFCDELVRRGFIKFNAPGMYSRMNPGNPGYKITTAGRKFVMEDLAK
jgi:hypothetical protein